MNKSIRITSALSAAGLVLAACAAAAPQAKPNTLVAVKVPATSLDAGASYWAQAPKLVKTTEPAEKGGPQGTTVTMQAAYDDKYVTIRSEWADTTESLYRNAWQFDGKAFKRAEDQDRLAITWPMGNNADFASKGCAFTCHNTDPDKTLWWMGSDKPEVKYDNWHWKAGQGGGAGYADDYSWSVLTDPKSPGSPRIADKSTSGGIVDNINAEKTAPKFMSNKGTAAKFIFAGEEIPLDVTKLKAGDVIPGSITSRPVGSRGDVEAKQEWAAGKWTLVMRRALNTGNDDDTVFVPPKAVPFGLAISDHAGDADHSVVPDTLTLEWSN